jgi:hypothetical protein
MVRGGEIMIIMFCLQMWLLALMLEDLYRFRELEVKRE